MRWLVEATYDGAPSRSVVRYADLEGKDDVTVTSMLVNEQGPAAITKVAMIVTGNDARGVRVRAQVLAERIGASLQLVLNEVKVEQTTS